MSPIPLGILAASGAGVPYDPAFDLLQTTTTGASTITFSGLGAYADYKHLQLRAVMRGTRGSADADLFFRGNGVSSSSYAWHSLTANGSSVSGLQGTNQSSVILGKIPGNTETANVFASMVLDIYDFASSTKNTSVKATLGVMGSNFQQVSFTTGLFIDTSALTSFDVLPESNNFNNSRFSLYGVRG